MHNKTVAYTEEQVDQFKAALDPVLERIWISRLAHELAVHAAGESPKQYAMEINFSFERFHLQTVYPLRVRHVTARIFQVQELGVAFHWQEIDLQGVTSGLDGEEIELRFPCSSYTVSWDKVASRVALQKNSKRGPPPTSLVRHSYLKSHGSFQPTGYPGSRVPCSFP